MITIFFRYSLPNVKADFRSFYLVHKIVLSHGLKALVHLNILDRLVPVSPIFWLFHPLLKSTSLSTQNVHLSVFKTLHMLILKLTPKTGDNLGPSYDDTQ